MCETAVCAAHGIDRPFSFQLGSELMVIPRRIRFLLLSVAAWHLAFGLLLLIRRTGTRELTEVWIPQGVSQWGAWVMMSSLFGVTYWLFTIVTESARFRIRPFRDVLVFKVFAVMLALAAYFLLTRLLAVTRHEISLVEAWQSVIGIVTSPAALATVAYIAAVTLTLSIIRLLATIVGSRVLINLLLGKYHQPKTERRIFMFLDLADSTGHAERMGHGHFSRLIQECFRDLAQSALEHDVEIYQYVGDEAILTWLPSDGLKQANCVRVYFDFQRALHARRDFYLERFGVVPRFKAGVNMGLVTVAEVGVIKRDIAYLSDVLNTAARLEGLCAEYQADLLVSGHVKQAIPAAADLRFDRVGALPLRGRIKPIDVFRVSFADTPTRAQAIN